LLEHWVGSVWHAAIYLASGVAGAVGTVLWAHAELSAGASGAIFGLLGALIAVLVRRRERLAPPGRQLLTQLVAWAGINIVFGLPTPGIDNAGHLGGAVMGFLLGLGVRPVWERQEPGQAAVPENQSLNP